MSRIATGLCLALCACAARAEERKADPVDSLQPRHWLEVPDSRMKSVAFKWPKGVRYSVNNIGVRGVIALWSGAAYDTKRDRLIVWGGGHKGYAGNEIYAFDVHALKWERVTDPTLKVNDKPHKPGRYVDGLPRSCHTYNYIQYVPAIDRFCSFGTAGGYPSGNDNTSVTWQFDFETKTWEDKGTALARGIGAYSAVDPVSGHVFVRGNYPATRFAEWDPETNEWTDRTGRVNHRTDYRKTGAIDPIGRRFFGVGGGRVYLYEFGKPGKIKQQIITTKGPQDVVKAGSPGLGYDPVIDRIVGWKGGPELFTLDLETLTWETVEPAATNQLVPGKPCGNGTYGRFRYVPSKNVYILVNSWDTNVFVYSLSDLKTAEVPTRFKGALKSEDAALKKWAMKQVVRFGNAMEFLKGMLSPEGRKQMDKLQRKFEEDRMRDGERHRNGWR
jgi:hypothetical protein